MAMACCVEMRAVFNCPMALVAIVALAAPLGAVPARASEANAIADASARLTFDSLLARFRAIPGLSARYREEKRITLLAEPLVSEGTVHYAPPQRLARHTRSPAPSSIVFDGTTLRFGDAKSEERIDVSSNPVVRAFVESFVSVLAGDRSKLERTFVVGFRAGDAAHPGEHWELSLVPRDSSLLGVLREVRFAGDGVVVSQMRIREASGDEAITTFSDVDVAHRYAPDEAARVFRVSRDQK
jgi:outer membrane lipoprotein-sorting protein